LKNHIQNPVPSLSQGHPNPTGNFDSSGPGVGIKRKMRAYHVFIQAGVVTQGLLQYLAVVAPKLVWDSFGSWLRTIRPGIPPSEFVVANAYLLDSPDNDSLAKFIADRQDTGSIGIFRLAA
jgi:hypothetical protein